MPNNVLLLGNGINRIKSNAYSWGDLINDLINEFCNGNINNNRSPSKPFPLLYEEILSYALSHGTGNEDSIKNYIRNKIERMLPNTCHYLIRNQNFADILTTNFDYTIEKALGEESHFELAQGYPNELKYSLFRKKVTLEPKSLSIWHLHGEAKKIGSITLGYEHYSGHLQHLREFVKRKPKVDDQSYNLWIRLLKGKIGSWVDYFFSHNIHIVGLGLDFSELDLWWLLVYRSRIIMQVDKENGMYNIQNKIYYYHEQHKGANAQLHNKLEILKSLGVTLVPIPLRNNNYQGLYTDIFTNKLRL